MSKEISGTSIELKELMKLLSEALTGSKRKEIRIKEPDIYDGARDASIIDSWTKSIERYAEFHGLDDNQAGLLAITLLRGRADAWYRSVESSEENVPVSWLFLKRELIGFFRPDNSVRIARDKLATLVQTGSLAEYINDFLNIKLEIPNMTEEEAVDKFTRSLRSHNLRTYIRQNDPTLLKNAIHIALSFDSARQDTFSGVLNTINRQREVIADDPMDLDTIESSDRRSNAGFRGGFRSTGGFDGPGGSGGSRGGRNYGDFRGGGGGSKSKIICHFCGKAGHILRLCKNRQAAIKKLVDDPARKRQGFHFT
jgi:hypothetical protein